MRWTGRISRRLGPTAPPLETAGIRDTLAPGDFEDTLDHDGLTRWFLLHLPPQIADGRPLPMIINCHGGLGSPYQQQRDSAFDAVADREGVIMLYPAGSGPFPRRGLTFNAGICCGHARENRIDDVGFIDALTQHLRQRLPIDPSRIYATGFSNGAFLAYRLAAEWTGHLAAIGPVSGVLGIAPGAVTPLAIMHIHGRDDPMVPFTGGVGAHSVEQTHRPSVTESLAPWLQANGCGAPRLDHRVGQATCTIYDGTPPIHLWAIDDGGHTWPGGASSLPSSLVGHLSSDISAAEELWRFFSRFTQNVQD